jgi:hypothetical protein
MSQPIDLLFPYIQPELSNCPNELIRDAIRQAAVELCSRSNVWTGVLDPMPLMANYPVIDLDSPSGAEVNTILRVWMPSGPLCPVDMDALINSRPDWLTAVGTPSGYLREGQNSLRLYPIPTGNDAGQPVYVRVSYRPKLKVKELPDFLISEWYDALIAGAKARLFLIPGNPWTNAQIAMEARARFNERIGDAKADELRGSVRRSVSVKPRRFL